MTQYRIPVEETFSWQRPVKSVYASGPPAVNAKGDRYIVGATPTDEKSWVGKEKKIATCSTAGDADTATWLFDTPAEGWCTYNDDLGRFYKYDGAAWGLMESGLGDMLKSTYDADDDGIVDKAASVDDGAGNVSTAAQVKDAVTKAHEHANKVVLDAIEEAFTSALKASYDAAVAAAHSHANKAILDAIEEAFTSALKAAYDDAVDKAHTHANIAVLDAIEEAFTTALKGNYDLAYSRRGSYDADFGSILMNI